MLIAADRLEAGDQRARAPDASRCSYVGVRRGSRGLRQQQPWSDANATGRWPVDAPRQQRHGSARGSRVGALIRHFGFAGRHSARRCLRSGSATTAERISLRPAVTGGLPEESTSMKALVVHGHSDQPPRENPSTGRLEHDPIAQLDGRTPTARNACSRKRSDSL